MTHSPSSNFWEKKYWHNFFRTYLFAISTKNGEWKCGFLWNLLRLQHTVVTSFCMHFEKWGCGLLRNACQGEGECPTECKGEGEVMVPVLKNGGKYASTSTSSPTPPPPSPPPHYYFFTLFFFILFFLLLLKQKSAAPLLGLLCRLTCTATSHSHMQLEWTCTANSLPIHSLHTCKIINNSRPLPMLYNFVFFQGSLLLLQTRFSKFPLVYM